MTVFLRILDASVDKKAEVLREAVCDSAEFGNARRFVVNPSEFASIPRSPFSYWIASSVREIFRRKPALEGTLASVRNGALTYDDFRFVRLMWETPETPAGSVTSRVWSPLNKGGGRGRFYFRFYLCINWRDNASELRAFYDLHTEGKGWGGFARNEVYYYRPSVTWSLRTNGLDFRFMPAGFVFSHKGPGLFHEEDQTSHLMAAAAVVNSLPFRALVALQLARTELAQSYEVGLIQQTPVPELGPSDMELLAGLARRVWSIRRRLDSSNETSPVFLLPLDPNMEATSFDVDRLEREAFGIQAEIDNRIFQSYGIGSADRAMIEATAEGATLSPLETSSEETVGIPQEDGTEDDTPTTAPRDMHDSWLVGVAFGRFDVRLATGERKPPPEPEPFDPLPTRSPGMWPENEPRDVEPPSILVDDPGHKLDLTKAVAAIAELIGADEPDNLRGWLAKEFFPLHIKMYSKSRRKAPIYWQLATPTTSYSVWLYLHAFTKDTFFHVQDLVTAKAEHEERVLERLRSEQERHGSSTASRKTLAAQETFVDELRGMLEEVKRVKPLWQPDLDDGVIINFAPLWRLVPHHKPWQKELRTTWDALVAGEYDWAHLAMHLWPERVVPKCATDRSLAIAHGLEDVFWFEDDAGKWKPRPTPTRPVAELVAERTSAAVQAARDSLLNAGNPGIGSGKTRRKRTTGPRSRR